MGIKPQLSNSELRADGCVRRERVKGIAWVMLRPELSAGTG